jgi:hypothetical protein
MLKRKMPRLELIPCRFCGKKIAKLSHVRRGVLYERKPFYYFKCDECKSYFLMPELQKEELVKLYSLDYTDDANKAENNQSYESKFVEVRNFLSEKNLTENKVFLDYGCGANSLPIVYAREGGYVALGMEYDLEVRSLAATNTGAEILSRDEIVRIDRSLDVIFLGDVLEHLNNPLDELLMLTSKLSENGVIYIQGPLEGAPTLMHKFIEFYCRIQPTKLSEFPPYHVNLFSLKGMLKLAEKSNLSLKRLDVKEINWPAPTFSELKSNLSLRAVTLFVLKFCDKLLANVVAKYGTRVTLVLERSNQ